MATIFLPVQQAIFLGVVIQFLLVILQSAQCMTIMELVPTKDGDFEERPAPEVLPSDQLTMLFPYVSFFFAACLRALPKRCVITVVASTWPR